MKRVLIRFLRWIKMESLILRIPHRIIKDRIKALRKYPNTIQLPITHKCNCDCVRCGMHHMIERNDFNSEQLKTIVSDDLFKRVKYVGLNGGEPFLKDDLADCVKTLVETLPRLKVINIISNGFFTKLVLDKLSEIRLITKWKIRINLSISIYWIVYTHDFHRRKDNSF